MTRSQLKKALRKNKKKQRDLDGKTLEELEKREEELEREADSLRQRAEEKERQARKVRKRIAQGDYGTPEDQKEEMQALKEEEARLRRVLERTDSETVKV